MALLAVFVVPFAAGSTAFAASTCNDGTPIPASAVVADNGTSYCNVHRGVSGTGTFCKDGSQVPDSAIVADNGVSYCKAHGGVKPPTVVTPPTPLDSNPIVKDLKLLINLLSAGVAVIVVISLIFAGIQYTTSGGDAQKVAAAKSRIYNSVFALVAFLFLYAFLQWLVPGGVF